MTYSIIGGSRGKILPEELFFLKILATTLQFGLNIVSLGRIYGLPCGVYKQVLSIYLILWNSVMIEEIERKANI